MIRAALVLGVILTAAPTHANPTSDKLAAEANDLASKGDFRGAAEKFAQGYRADPSKTELFCNAGISRYKAGDLPRAHLLLSQCLDRSALDKGFVDAMRAALKAVDDTLRGSGHTPVTVRVNPSTSAVVIVEFGPDDAFVGPRTVWLPFGKFTLTVHAEGFRNETVAVEAVDQQPKVVEIGLTRLEAKPPPLLPTKPIEKPRSKIPAIVATSVTGVAVGFTVLSFVKGRSAATRGEFALDSQALDQQLDKVSKWNTVMVVTGVLAIGGAAATGFLWRASTKARVEVASTPGGASLSFGSRF